MKDYTEKYPASLKEFTDEYIAVQACFNHNDPGDYPHGHLVRAYREDIKLFNNCQHEYRRRRKAKNSI